MADNSETSRKVSFEYNGISVNLEVSDPLFLKFYDSNPSRVKNILLASFCGALGDIYAGERLDSIMNDISMKAQKQKSLLLKTLVQEEQYRKN